MCPCHFFHVRQEPHTLYRNRIATCKGRYCQSDGLDAHRWQQVRITHQGYDSLSPSLLPVARLIVEYDGTMPADSIRTEVADLANKQMKTDLVVEVHKLARSEAESKFKSRVNGQFIYEKRAPPASVEEVNVVEIPDWTTVCTTSTDFVETTGLVGNILVERFNHRPQKKELEICVQLNLDNQSSQSTTTEQVPIVLPPQLSTSPYDNVNVVSENLVAKFFATLKSANVAITDEQYKEVSEKMLKETQYQLTQVKNKAYASGFKCQ